MDWLYEIGGLLLMLAVLAGVVYWKLEKEGFFVRRESAESIARRLLEQINRSNFEIRDAGTVIEAMQTEIKLLSSAMLELRRMAFAAMDKAEKARLEGALKMLEKGDSEEAAKIFNAEFDSLAAAMKASGAEYRELRRKAAQMAAYVGIVQYLNDTPLALAAFIKAADHNPDDPQIWSMLGAVWMRLGELDNAEGLLRRALDMQRNPQEKSLLASDFVNLGQAYADRDNYARACAFWQRARGLYAGLGMDERLERIDRIMNEAGCRPGGGDDKIH